MEVQNNGVWGTVCAIGWDLNDAQVVCSQLGLGKASAAMDNSFYGQGTGQIWLYNLNCVGTEWAIGNCSHRRWDHYSDYFCGRHQNDAGVRCSSGM